MSGVSQLTKEPAQEQIKLADSVASLKSAEIALREQLRQIASTEFNRRRRRLGLLTNEQELAIESLLNSTVECISKPVLERAHQCCAAGDERKALALCSVFQNEPMLAGGGPEVI